MSETEVLSMDDFRNRLFESLKKRGFVDVLKTQLRNRLVAELKEGGLSRTIDHHHSETENQSVSSQLYTKAVDSLIANHLKHSNYNYSLSVFLPEAGITQEALYSLSDVLQLLRISSQSKLYKQLITHENSKGILWQIISEICMSYGHPTIESGCQTEVTSRYPTITTLEEQLAKVDAHYTNMESAQLLKASSVEERMLSYQRQLEQRYRSELDMAMARFKENELARVQVIEREQNRKELDKAMKEMERMYRSKYDAMCERERNAVEQLQKQQEIGERELFSQRQKMLDDIEALQQREVQVRRQLEVDARERSLWEEKVKTREELAKRCEEAARRAQLDHEQRVRDEVNKFKLEEQSRYVERLTTVELRESRIKDNERRLDENLQETSNMKVDLIEKNKRLHELEAELIRTRHELLSAQKQADLLGERTREIVDYQILKENNAVMKRELDNAKLRMAELMKDNMIERQKQEELLREMSVQAGKPAPEVSLLRHQIDQLQSRHRTEIAIHEQEKLQLQQRLENEVARNKELVMKYEHQTWQQKQFGLEATDLREQLHDSNLTLRSRLYHRPSVFDGSGSFADSEPDVETDQFLPTQHRETECLRRSPPPHLPDDQSCSSDVVQDTKNRLRRLEAEADALEKNYRNFQFRITTIDPVIGPPVLPQTESNTGVGHKQSNAVDNPTLTTIGTQFSRPSYTVKIDDGVGSAIETAASCVPAAPLVHSRVSGKTSVYSLESMGKAGGDHRTSLEPPISSSALARRGNVLEDDLPNASKPVGVDNLSEINPPISSSRVEDALYQRVSAATTVPISSKHGDTLVKNPRLEKLSSKSKDLSEGHSGEVVEESKRVAHVDKSSDESSNLSGHLQAEPVRISLDDAWKSMTGSRATSGNLSSSSESNDARLQREKDEQEEFEKQRKQKDEERRRVQEEAWLKEQRELEELTRKQDSSQTRVAGDRQASASSSTSSSVHEVLERDSRADGPAKPADSSAEPPIDPFLAKYLEIVMQQKEQEKQQAKAKGNDRTKIEKASTPAQSEEDISNADANSASSGSVDKDEFW